jgi:hypothetical protein
VHLRFGNVSPDALGFLFACWISLPLTIAQLRPNQTHRSKIPIAESLQQLGEVFQPADGRFGMEGNLVVNFRNGCGCHTLLLSWDLRFSQPWRYSSFCLAAGRIRRGLITTHGNPNIGASFDQVFDVPSALYPAFKFVLVLIALLLSLDTSSTIVLGG